MGAEHRARSRDEEARHVTVRRGGSVRDRKGAQVAGVRADGDRLRHRPVNERARPGDAPLGTSGVGTNPASAARDGDRDPDHDDSRTQCDASAHLTWIAHSTSPPTRAIGGVSGLRDGQEAGLARRLTGGHLRSRASAARHHTLSACARRPQLLISIARTSSRPMTSVQRGCVVPDAELPRGVTS